MAVHDVPTKPIAESHFDGRAALWYQSHRILARQVDPGFSVGGTSRPAVLISPLVVIVGIIRAAAIQARRTLDDLVLLGVNMNGMRPVPAVLEIPLFEAVLLDGKASGI